MNILELIKDIDITQVLDRLNINIKKTGAGILQGDCITGHDSQSHKCFTVYEASNSYYCFSCGIAGSNIDLVMTVRGIEFKEAAEWLIEEFRPELKKAWRHGGNKEDITKIEAEGKAFVNNALMYEEVYKFGRDLIFQDRAIEVRQYLYSRGYTDELIKATQWFYYPTQNEILSHLKSITRQSIEIKLQGHLGDNFRLALPYRNRRGQITGFYKRAHKPIDGTSENKDYTVGLQKTDPYGLHACRGKQTVIIVEGLPDCELLRALGIDNIIGLGQANISDTHIEALKAFKVETVILAPDNDKAGLQSIEKNMSKLNKAGLRVYVIDPAGYGRGKDPDELVRAEGIEAFRGLVKMAAPSGVWIVNTILNGYDTTTYYGLNEAIYKISEAVAGLDKVNQNQAVNLLVDKTQLEYEAIQDIIDKQSEKIEKDRHVKEQMEGLKYAEALIRTGQDKDYLKALKTLITGAEVRNVGAVYEPDINKAVSQIKSGLKTGIINLDDNIRIPTGAITIVGGRPSHGKTSLLMNLCLNMMKLYPDKTFLFYSYEEGAGAIYIKMGMSLIYDLLVANDKDINNYGYSYNNVLYILNNPQTKHNLLYLTEAYNELQDYITQGRLKVSDIHLHIDKLTSLIRHEQDKHNNIGCVFIDYIQKVRGFEDTINNQTRIQRISNEILQTAVDTNIPIVLGAQVSREALKGKEEALPELYHLRESGDIEQDANLVLTIFRDIENKPSDLQVGVKKNRGGIVGSRISLTFISNMYKVR